MHDAEYDCGSGEMECLNKDDCDKRSEFGSVLSRNRKPNDSRAKRRNPRGGIPCLPMPATQK